jgi:transcriptional regulator with XRE-family HTH domain
MPATRSRRKHRLGLYLRKLREDAGLQAVAVATHLGCTPTTVGRYESGQTVPKRRDLDLILNLIGVTPEQRAEAESRYVDASAETARVEFSSAVPPKFRAFLRAEADAERETVLAPIGVPGLLQTPAYARLVQEAGRALVDEAVDQERLVAARVNRRRHLERDVHPLRLCALVDEGVVRRVERLGTVGREQLDHLIRLGGRRNVTISVVPFDAGLYGSVSGPVTLFEYPDDLDPDAVYLEYPGGGAWVEDEEGVARFRRLLHAVADVALSHDQSMHLIAEARRE